MNTYDIIEIRHDDKASWPFVAVARNGETVNITTDEAAQMTAGGVPIRHSLPSLAQLTHERAEQDDYTATLADFEAGTGEDVDMETSPEINELAAALSAFQGTVTTIHKSSTVSVKMKSGGTYSYSYAPLDSILDAVRKPLSDNGLAVTQLLIDNGLVTMLTHSSGQWLRSATSVAKGADIKAQGGNITYMRRYALSAILGLATSEDVDGDTDEPVSVKHSNGKAADKPPTVDASQTKPSAGQMKAFHALGHDVYGDEWDDKRPVIVSAITKGRSKSSLHLTRAEYDTLMAGMNTKKADRETT